MSTIITKNSSVASAVPTPADLEQGELAVNVTDKRLFTENASGSVVELGTNPTSVTTGAITSTGVSVGNLSISSGTITDSSGSISFGNENISTTGTLASGNFSVTGNISVTGTVDGIDVSDAVTFSASDVSSASWVIDEDAMSSDSDTKVPTQQSVKTYVDNTLISIGAVTVDPTPVANDFAKFTSGTELTGRSYSEVRTDLGLVIGTDVQAYDSNLTDFVTTFTLPTVDGTSGQALTTNGSGGIGFTTIDTDPTLGTLDQSFTTYESATITLSSAVTSGAPNVSVTKEVPQVGVTNNYWDAAASSYELEDSAYSTTLDFVFYNVSGSVFSQAFDVVSQDTAPRGMTFNNDGTKMFVVGSTGLDINEYTLSTAYDVSTASFVDAFSISAQDNNPYNIAFNPTGTVMFLTGTAGSDINEYSLSTGFDISTASFVDAFSVSGQATSPTGVAFNADGTKMFVLDNVSDTIYQYSMSTAYDVSTSSYDTVSFSVNSQDTSPIGLAFNPDGTKMFVTGFDGDDVNQYNLSSAFDITTASFEANFSTSAQEASPASVAFNADGTKIYICGSGSTDVNEYNAGNPTLTLGTGSFASTDVGKTITANSGVFILTATDGSNVETTAPTSYDQVASGDWTMYAIVYDSSNDRLELSGVTVGTLYSPSQYQPAISANIDTTYWTDINSLTATDSVNDGAVYYAISDDSRTTWSVQNSSGTVRDIARNNAGTWEYNSNATFGSETWTSATSNTEIQALRDAMGSALYTIDQYDITTASYIDAYDYSAQETDAQGFCFNNDGTKMYVLGNIGNDVNEYSLSTAYDVSTASFTTNYSVNSQDTTPNGVAFNNDGTKMFVGGQDGTDINEYTLSVGFDLTSTVTFIDSLSTTSSAVPRGLDFNSDGTKMYVASEFPSPAVQEYGLGTGFDVSTSTGVSYTLDVSGKETGIRDVVFSSDGTEMYITGTSSDSIHQYTLSIAFDLSTATFTASYDVSAQSGAPKGIEINSDGTKIYVLDASTDDVFEYSMGTEVSRNQMTSTTLNALTDGQQITLTNDLDFAAIFYLASGSTVPTYSGTAINYDANTLNEGAVIGTDYDWDFPATDKVRITSLGNYNLKVRVV